VFALANRQPEPVEDAALALDDRRIEQLENGLIGHSSQLLAISYQLSAVSSKPAAPNRSAEIGRFTDS
jgi:hypothetical protein